MCIRDSDYCCKTKNYQSRVDVTNSLPPDSRILERFADIGLEQQNLVPSEYKDLGEDVADIWANLLDVAKSVGCLLYTSG